VTISVVQNKVFNAASSGSLNSNVAAGNTVYLWMYMHGTAATMSTSNPTYNGSSVSGATQLISQQSPTSSSVYQTIWQLPNLAGGAANFSVTTSGGTVDSFVGMGLIEVSGLGTAPVLDSTSPNPALGSGSTGAVTAGPTGNIVSSPDLILASAVSFGQGLTTPGGAWLTNGPAGATLMGWQVATSSGGNYTFSPTSGATVDWNAAVIAIQVTPAAVTSGTVQPRATVPVPRRASARVVSYHEAGPANAHGPSGVIPALMVNRTEVTGRSTGRIIRR
jgi:hypothetical protein